MSARFVEKEKDVSQNIICAGIVIKKIGSYNDFRLLSDT